jgi:hypothetical protein
LGIAVDDEVRNFMHQRQQLLFETQSYAQHDAPFFHAPEHPCNEGVANHGRAVPFGELFEAADCGL